MVNASLETLGMVPPAGEVSRQLAAAEAAVRVLKQQLRVSERAERERQAHRQVKAVQPGQAAG
jgi:hypothetical protein